MEVNNIGTAPRTNSFKREAKSAALSGVLSAGLTLALNKGKNVKNAAVVGLFAAGVSVAIGGVQKAIVLHKINKQQQAMPNLETTKIGYHNG